MNCPYCGASIPNQSQFCPGCGTKIPSQTVRPYSPEQPAPAPHPVQPVLGMIFGIIGAVLSVVAYVVMLDGAISGEESAAVFPVLVILTLVAAVLGLIFSIIGMVRSIRTGGRRKYVAGIVFSAVGISCAAFAFIYLILTVFLGVVFSDINDISDTAYRYGSYY